MPEQPLCNRVAVVAGATCGAGRGSARMLGAAGATVYCTGRSVQGRPATPGRPETIEETAALVTAEGGRGIAVRTDHTVESKVEQLFARVRAEAGRLDVLVNDIWGGDALTEWGRPFWELTIAQGQQMLERAVHSHIITSRHGASLMIERAPDSSSRSRTATRSAIAATSSTIWRRTRSSGSPTRWPPTSIPTV